MLRDVVIDQKPNGKKIIIPVEVTKENRDQQVKIFVEIAGYSLFDGQLHISLFRQFHGGEKTLQVLHAAVQELQQPSIKLDTPSTRSDLVPFFVSQLERHGSMKDADFGDPGDHSKLPI